MKTNEQNDGGPAHTLSARDICQRFANKHKLIFDDEGECGFGRECVGLRHGDSWLDHNPHSRSGDYDPIKELACDAAYPPDGVDAYHKRNCLAVLGRGEGAIEQLARWIQHMESQGKVSVRTYETGASGIQALISGVIGHAVYIESRAEKGGVS